MKDVPEAGSLVSFTASPLLQFPLNSFSFVMLGSVSKLMSPSCTIGPNDRFPFFAHFCSIFHLFAFLWDIFGICGAFYVQITSGKLGALSRNGDPTF